MNDTLNGASLNIPAEEPVNANIPDVVLPDENKTEAENGSAALQNTGKNAEAETTFTVDGENASGDFMQTEREQGAITNEATDDADTSSEKEEKDFVDIPLSALDIDDSIKHKHTNNSAKRKKKNWSLVVFIAVNVIVIAITAMFEFGGDTQPETDTLYSILSSIGRNWYYLLLAIASFLFLYVFQVLKIALMIKASTGKQKIKPVIKSVILGKYYDNITPLPGILPGTKRSSRRDGNSRAYSSTASRYLRIFNARRAEHDILRLVRFHTDKSYGIHRYGYKFPYPHCDNFSFDFPERNKEYLLLLYKVACKDSPCKGSGKNQGKNDKHH